MTEPTDAELWQLHMQMPGVHKDPIDFARAVLAKWGTPASVGVEPVALLVRKNSWRDGQWEAAPPNSPSYGLAWANQRVYVYTSPQPTHAQAGAITPPPIECDTEELKRAYAFGWWSALEKQRETAQAGAVPLSAAQKQQIHNETGAGHALICLVESYLLEAHSIKGGQHGIDT